MKNITFPQGAFAILAFATIGASAQLITHPTLASDGIDYSHQSSFAADRSLSGAYILPTITKSEADPSESTLFVNQDASSLSAKRTSRNSASVLDVSALKESSAYRNAMKVKVKVSDKQASGIHSGLEQISAAYQKPGSSDDATGCNSIGMSMKHRLSVDPSLVLEIVEAEISANPDCSCDIVKTAIIATGANPELASSIAETAIVSAPDKMRMITQCAIAALPEALPNIQAVLARLDPNSGDTNYSAKDSKSGKDAAAADLSGADPAPDILAIPNSPFTVITPNTTIPGDVSNPNNPDAPGFVPTVVVDPDAPVAPDTVTDPNPGAPSL